MSLEEIKDSFSTLSPKAILVTLSIILPAIAGTAYVGITTYNRIIAATEAIESAKPYDDAEIKKAISNLEKIDAETKTEIDAINNVLLSNAQSSARLSESLARAQEKASDASGTATEAKAIANGTTRETQAALQSIREEVKATRDGMDAQLKALKRATTNPLGN
jgi:hypothetical protein